MCNEWKRTYERVFELLGTENISCKKFDESTHTVEFDYFNEAKATFGVRRYKISVCLGDYAPGFKMKLIDNNKRKPQEQKFHYYSTLEDVADKVKKGFEVLFRTHRLPRV
jgi:hypothetical protein